MENIFYNKAIKVIGIINCVLAIPFIFGFLIIDMLSQQNLGLLGLFPIAMIICAFGAGLITSGTAEILLIIKTCKNLSKTSTLRDRNLAIITSILTCGLLLSVISIFTLHFHGVIAYTLISVIIFAINYIPRKNELIAKKIILAAIAYLFPIILILIGAILTTPLILMYGWS